MKIVLVNKYARVTGGADRHVIDLATRLVARGHRVRFLSSPPPAGFEFGGEYVDATVTHATREQLGLGETIRVGATLVWNRSAAAAMSRLIDAERPDVVHVHKAYPQLSVAPAVIAAARGVPIVQTAHDYEFISANAEDERGSALDRSSARLADRGANTITFALRRRRHVPRVSAWIVASTFVQHAYARRGIDARVLPLFTLSADDRPRPDVDGRSGIVFAGRLVKAKGIVDVVEVARRHPEIPVTVAGAGELEGYVSQEAALLPNLRFVGHVGGDELERLVESARVSLIPSRWAEPAGLVALEAMARGTPVVAYSSGGLAEYVTSGGGGVLVGTADVGALAEAAAGLHEDRERWLELSATGRDGVLGRHDPDTYVEGLEAIYSEAMDAGALTAGRTRSVRARHRRGP